MKVKISNVLGIVLSISLIIVSLAIGYYLVVLLPARENRIQNQSAKEIELEIKKQAQQEEEKQARLKIQAGQECTKEIGTSEESPHKRYCIDSKLKAWSE